MYPYKRETDIDTQKRRSTEDGTDRELRMPALKIGGVWPQAKECQQPAENGRGRKQILP